MDPSKTRLRLVPLLKDSFSPSKRMKLVRNARRRPLASSPYSSDCISVMLSGAAALSGSFSRHCRIVPYLCRLFRARSFHPEEALRGDQSRDRRHLSHCSGGGGGSGSGGGLLRVYLGPVVICLLPDRRPGSDGSPEPTSFVKIFRGIRLLLVVHVSGVSAPRTSVGYSSEMSGLFYLKDDESHRRQGPPAPRSSWTS